MMSRCVSCYRSIEGRARRCADCERSYQRVRNAAPSRAKYRDPQYISLVPAGLCHWGCGRRADTREHLRSGAIVFACRSCNSGRQERRRVR